MEKNEFSIRVAGVLHIFARRGLFFFQLGVLFLKGKKGEESRRKLRGSTDPKARIPKGKRKGLTERIRK